MSGLRRAAWAVVAASAFFGGTAFCGPLAATATTAPYAAPQTLARLPDGRSYNFVCMGAGAPTAVLDVGLGDWSVDWAALQPELARITRVCVADRAGYGFSSPGPFPRDSLSETRDLEDALRGAGLRPPYVVMGHSLGGLNARLFSYRNPEKVAGLLLIDPSVDFKEFGTRAEFAAKMGLSFYRYCLAQARAGKLVAGEIRKGDPRPCLAAPERRWRPKEADLISEARSAPSVFETTLAEFESAYDMDVGEVSAARRPLGDIPLIILTQDAAHFGALKPWFADNVDAVYSRWVAGHDDEARDSSRGENRIVSGAGHDIEIDRPDAVVSALREIVDDVRRPRTAEETRPLDLQSGASARGGISPK